jgi:hypothetical protein
MEIAGDIAGTGTWIFEPTDGKTKVKYQFRVRTNSLLFSVLSPFVNLEKGHSAEVQQVLKELNSYLLKQGNYNLVQKKEERVILLVLDEFDCLFSRYCYHGLG